MTQEREAHRGRLRIIKPDKHGVVRLKKVIGFKWVGDNAIVTFPGGEKAKIVGAKRVEIEKLELESLIL